MKVFTTATILALLMAARTFAAPVDFEYTREDAADAGADADSGYDTMDHTIAARIPEPTPGPSPDLVRRAIDKMTITVINKHGAPITTRHANNAGRPRPVAGNVGSGVMKSGASDTFVVPRNWAGAVFVNDAKYTPNQHCSQIEGALIDGKMSFDVSYVTGFSLPIVCKCNNGVTSGCNKDLFKMGNCPNMAGGNEHVCKNPFRDNSVTKNATPFFKACQGKSYTFVNDHAAIRHDLCQDGHLKCCVGAACAA